MPAKRQHGPRGFGFPGPTSAAQPVSLRHWGSRYAVAVGATAACAGLHLLFGDRVSRTPFLTYMPAIVGAGIYGGFGPGLTATALGGVSAVSIMLSHPSWAQLRGAGLAVPLAIYGAVGAMISYISHLLHRAVGSLRGNERSFQNVVDSVTDYAIFMLDATGRVASWNKGAQKIKGYRPEEIIGEHFSRFFPPEEAAAGRPDRLLADAARLGSVQDEGWRRRKDGSLFWASVVITALKDENGDLSGFTKILRDLTERKVAEEAARERSMIALHVSEAKYKSLFESIDEGFCIVEVLFDESAQPADYRFVEVNPAFERLTGLRQAAGKTIRELSPGRAPGWFETYGRIALTGAPERFQTAGVLLENRWFDVYAWRYGQARERLVAVLVHDITDRKRRSEDMERAVTERTAELRSTVADLESFSYTVSHDLRSPLRAIQGCAFLAMERLKGRLDPETARLLERIESSSARMDRLVRDVLLFVQMGREKLIVTELDLEPIVAHVVETYDRMRGVKVVVDRPLGKVRGHETLLTQVLSNLLDNAVKFVPEGRTPEIKVRTERREPGWVRLIVADNGIGIQREHQARVFVPFVRLAPGKEDGTGIGLAIVRKAMEALGGKVGLSSEPGKGSAFWIDLPEGSLAP